MNRTIIQIVTAMFSLIALYLVLTYAQNITPALGTAFQGTQGILTVLQGRNPNVVGGLS